MYAGDGFSADDDLDQVDGEAVSIGVLRGRLQKDYLGDVRSSRAGGTPVWCGTAPPALMAAEEAGSRAAGGTVSPSCGLCPDPLWLVAQVYAPCQADQDRVIHVFGCNRKSCSVQPGEWLP